MSDPAPNFIAQTAKDVKDAEVFSADLKALQYKYHLPRVVDHVCGVHDPKHFLTSDRRAERVSLGVLPLIKHLLAAGKFDADGKPSHHIDLDGYIDVSAAAVEKTQNRKFKSHTLRRAAKVLISAGLATQKNYAVVTDSRNGRCQATVQDCRKEGDQWNIRPGAEWAGASVRMKLVPHAFLKAIRNGKSYASNGIPAFHAVPPPGSAQMRVPTAPGRKNSHVKLSQEDFVDRCGGCRLQDSPATQANRYWLQSWTNFSISDPCELYADDLNLWAHEKKNPYHFKDIDLRQQRICPGSKDLPKSIIKLFAIKGGHFKEHSNMVMLDGRIYVLENNSVLAERVGMNQRQFARERKIWVEAGVVLYKPVTKDVGAYSVDPDWLTELMRRMPVLRMQYAFENRVEKPAETLSLTGLNACKTESENVSMELTPYFINSSLPIDSASVSGAGATPLSVAAVAAGTCVDPVTKKGELLLSGRADGFPLSFSSESKNVESVDLAPTALWTGKFCHPEDRAIAKTLKENVFAWFPCFSRQFFTIQQSREIRRLRKYYGLTAHQVEKFWRIYSHDADVQSEIGYQLSKLADRQYLIDIILTRKFVYYMQRIVTRDEYDYRDLHDFSSSLMKVYTWTQKIKQWWETEYLSRDVTNPIICEIRGVIELCPRRIRTSGVEYRVPGGDHSAPRYTIYGNSLVDEFLWFVPKFIISETGISVYTGVPGYTNTSLRDETDLEHFSPELRIVLSYAIGKREKWNAETMARLKRDCKSLVYYSSSSVILYSWLIDWKELLGIELYNLCLKYAKRYIGSKIWNHCKTAELFIDWSCASYGGDESDENIEPPLDPKERREYFRGIRKKVWNLRIDRYIEALHKHTYYAEPHTDN
ncbi:MAG TPA: hypothetical protein VIW67_13695 [Terriglobales bacterium]|jgi:hypothetical protein